MHVAEHARRGKFLYLIICVLAFGLWLGFVTFSCDVFVRRPACVNTNYVCRSTCLFRVFVLAAARELRGMRGAALCAFGVLSPLLRVRLYKSREAMLLRTYLVGHPATQRTTATADP